MSSSDIRIIKDAKISCDPVVIAMHQFEKLDAMELLTDNSGCESANGSNAGHNLPEPTDKVLHLTIKKNAEILADKILQDAKTQSEKMFANASQEIARMKAVAANETENLKAQAVTVGKNQGLTEAQCQMTEQLKQTTERCNSAMNAAIQEANRIVQEAEPQIIELVLAISRKIIYDEMDEKPDIILRVVQSALERVRDQNHVNIHVGLEDYERILSNRNELQSILGSEQSLTVTADPVLGRGGCLIETSFGTVEAGVDTQLEAIRKALQEMQP